MSSFTRLDGIKKACNERLSELRDTEDGNSERSQWIVSMNSGKCGVNVLWVIEHGFDTKQRWSALRLHTKRYY